MLKNLTQVCPKILEIMSQRVSNFKILEKYLTCLFQIIDVAFSDDNLA